VEIIINRGYHAEMHPITTDDDYILMLHRIPYPKGRKSGPTGSPVLIPHGLAESSADWLFLPSNKSLGKLWWILITATLNNNTIFLYFKHLYWLILVTTFGWEILEVILIPAVMSLSTQPMINSIGNIRNIYCLIYLWWVLFTHRVLLI